jgi:hypothetical protein
MSNTEPDAEEDLKEVTHKFELLKESYESRDKANAFLVNKNKEQAQRIAELETQLALSGEPVEYSPTITTAGDEPEPTKRDYGYIVKGMQIHIDELTAQLQSAKSEAWVSVEKDSDYDGQYLGYLEVTEECGAVHKRHRIITNRMNKWLLKSNERLLCWQPLSTPDKATYIEQVKNKL